MINELHHQGFGLGNIAHHKKEREGAESGGDGDNHHVVNNVEFVMVTLESGLALEVTTSSLKVSFSRLIILETFALLILTLIFCCGL